MGFRDNIVHKLRIATNEKQQLHKQALRLNNSLRDVQKALGDKKEKSK